MRASLISEIWDSTVFWVCVRPAAFNVSLVPYAIFSHEAVAMSAFGRIADIIWGGALRLLMT